MFKRPVLTMEKLLLRFQHTHQIKYIFLATLSRFFASVLLIIVLSLIITLTQWNPSSHDLDDVDVLLFLFAVILGPIFETLIYQKLVIDLLMKFMPSRRTLIALISMLLFSLGHTRSHLNFLQAIYPGFMFAFTYMLFKERKESAFWTVTIIHGLCNAVSILLQLILV